MFLTGHAEANDRLPRADAEPQRRKTGQRRRTQVTLNSYRRRWGILSRACLVAAVLDLGGGLSGLSGSERVRTLAAVVLGGTASRSSPSPPVVAG
jgi:hypothetical protein